MVNLLIFIKRFYDFSTDFYELWPTFRIFMSFVASLQTYTDFMVINYDFYSFMVVLVGTIIILQP